MYVVGGFSPVVLTPLICDFQTLRTTVNSFVASLPCHYQHRCRVGLYVFENSKYTMYYSWSLTLEEFDRTIVFILVDGLRPGDMSTRLR